MVFGRTIPALLRKSLRYILPSSFVINVEKTKNVENVWEQAGLVSPELSGQANTDPADGFSNEMPSTTQSLALHSDIRQARICRAPEPVTTISSSSVYLSGPIESGFSPGWRHEIIRRLEHLPVTIFDPSGDNWDVPYGMTRHSDEQFDAQTSWELQNMERADVVAVYLTPRSMTPGSLLELGLLVGTKKVIVCCPDGFYRKGNVEFVCQERGIPLVETFDELVQEVTRTLTTLCTQPMQF